jgi:hypothetical protein
MTYIKGEDINIGIARETVRGNPEDPQTFIPGRTPTGIRQITDKVMIKETKGTGMTSQGNAMIMKRAEGDLEFNVRNGSIGYLLLSLLGKVTTSAAGSAYSHLFEILTGNPQHPSLTLALSQLGKQDYEYKKCICTSLEIRTPVDDLVNATATFIGTHETTHADYTVAFPSTDYYFRHYDVVIKLATNVAGLAAASALGLKEFSIKLGNNGRVNQNIGELNPGDVFGIMQEVTGSLMIDYQDETYHDIYAAETYKAMSITLARTDVDIDSGGGTQNPTIQIILPKISFRNLSPERPIDDIAQESIEWDAHHDDTLGYGIQITAINNVANYN